MKIACSSVLLWLCFTLHSAIICYYIPSYGCTLCVQVPCYAFIVPLWLPPGDLSCFPMPHFLALQFLLQYAIFFLCNGTIGLYYAILCLLCNIMLSSIMIWSSMPHYACLCYVNCCFSMPFPSFVLGHCSLLCHIMPSMQHYAFLYHDLRFYETLCSLCFPIS